ncbi:hypothetical protein F5Y13DRAFT_186105 [Hypoxylon sp. FL1857]|nr:hypothetical protein F5Y13DRAFT_186105 [Hypoxylon sp. FL1857]
MAKKTQKAVKPAKPAAPSTSRGETPPNQLMDLVESFLSDQGFDNAHREFQKHRAKKGWKEQGAKKHKDKEHHSLVSVFQTWKTFSSQSNTPVLPKEDPLQKITKVSSSSSDSDDSSSESDSDSDGSQDVAMADAPAADESSSSESSSSEDSESDSESESDEEAKPAKLATGASKTGVNPLKRKAESDSESSSDSDSDDDMSDSSSEEERPQAKRAKTTDSSDESSSSSSSDSSEDESSEDEDEAEPKVKTDDDDDDSSSGSDSDSSDSDSESDVDPKVDLKVAAQVPLPESSESESDSDDEKAQQLTKDSTMNGTASDSSVTLDKTSPDAPLPPDPTALKSNNRGKNGAKNLRGQNQPFSRIRKDVEIDPRLSSNAYVSHGYGEKAHQDLIVTKGKGFTKEKNKKKRGSYKGGPLDIHKSRSIKFED